MSQKEDWKVIFQKSYVYLIFFSGIFTILTLNHDHAAGKFKNCSYNIFHWYAFNSIQVRGETPEN